MLLCECKEISIFEIIVNDFIKIHPIYSFIIIFIITALIFWYIIIPIIKITND